MNIFYKIALTLMIFPFAANANENFRYLGFEFNKIPEKEVIKDYTCQKTDNTFKECYLSSNGRKYNVILDNNDYVRKVSQSISTSSYQQKFSCLEHLKSYASVLNNDYSANIKIPSYGLFSDFNSIININGSNFYVYGNCENKPDDVIFNSYIEDTQLSDDIKKESIVNKKDDELSNIKRDFQ